MGSLTGPINSVFSFAGHSAQKKQTKNALNAFKGADAAALGARDASLGYYQPFLEGGTTGFNNALAMQTPGYDYQSLDPGYNYIYDEAQRGVERSAAAQGALHSGGTIKGLARELGGIAAQDFGNSFQRNALLAGFGMQGAEGSAGAQQSYADNLLRSAFGKSGVYKDRGDAIAKQWGDAGNFVKGVGKFFGL